jgi:HK97 family phage prohead protease
MSVASLAEHRRRFAETENVRINNFFANLGRMSQAEALSVATPYERAILEMFRGPPAAARRSTPNVAPRLAPKPAPTIEELQARYRRPSPWTIEQRVASMERELRRQVWLNPWQPGYVVGLAAVYNSVLEFRDKPPMVFLPGAFAAVDAPALELQLAHKPQLTVLAGGAVELFDDPGFGLFFRAKLPDNDLGRGVAALMRAGKLGQTSIHFDMLRRSKNDGVDEVAQAGVYEISLTRSPREPLTLARLVEAPNAYRHGNYNGDFLASRLAALGTD